MDKFLQYNADNTIADGLLFECCQELGIDSCNPNIIYNRIYDIVEKLEDFNKIQKIPVGTTGTMTERLCEAGLICGVGDSYSKLPTDWKWVGDYFIRSVPFNVIISVKSFKAKERLLSSGSGNYLSPTIGFGLFNDVHEFTLSRISKYPFRAFLGIYVPMQLYRKLDKDVKELKNINNKTFIRKLDNFVVDLINAKDKSGDFIDITAI